MALNRYHGPRGGGRRLSALNALWLDLDTYRVSGLADLPRQTLADHICGRLAGAGLPPPSFLVDSGRGFYCLWLLRSIVPAALPRWIAALRALTAWA